VLEISADDVQVAGVVMVKWRGVALIFTLALLGGCSAAEAGQPAGGVDEEFGDLDLSVASEAQAAEIADREATFDEYQAAFQRYSECLSAAGYPLENVELKNQVYDFRLSNAAVESGVDAECYDGEYRFVDMLWQGRDEVWEQSETVQIMRLCLQEHGIEPAESWRENEQQMRDAGIEPPDCL
jgi:hypothetical protein